MKTLAIVGPTASGKSDLAMNIAGDLFEIISADSVQVYRYMNIGSCKPDLKDQEKVRHHLIDIVEPDYHFTAGEFCDRALSACSEIREKKKIPLFAGGTGLYINSYFDGISEIPDIDRSIKSLISEEADRLGLDMMYHELVSVDPEFASRVHCNDRQRIIRGLEVFRGTGRSLSSFHNGPKKGTDDDVFFLGIYIETSELRKRIDERVDKMISRGLVDEVENLRKMGFSPELNSMKSIGYSEINDYIDNKLTLENAVQNIKINTKKYAKKQLTWFKRRKNISWFETGEINRIKEKIKNWLNL